MTDDVEEVEVDGPSDNELKSVVELAREQWRCEREVERLEAELQAARDNLKNVAERELPNLMAELGMQGFTLQNGAQLVLEENTYASITQANREAAYQWLDEHEHGDLIKREFNIRFNREDEKWAAKFQRDLNQRKRKLDSAVKRSVHPGTLQKFVREALLTGLVIPEDLFGVYKKKTTKIIPPKKPTELEP